MAKYKYEFLDIIVHDYTIVIDVRTRIKTLLLGREIDKYDDLTYSGTTTMISPDGTPDLATDEEIEYLKSIAVEYRSSEWYKMRKGRDSFVVYRCAEL